MSDQVQRLPDGTLVASRDAPVGGQAVLEGVMMRGTGHWAVAVREPAGEIVVERFALRSALQRHRVLRSGSRWPSASRR
jgi:uncharacterized protein YqhQ